MNNLILRKFDYDPFTSMFQFVKSVFPKVDLIENAKMLMVKAYMPGVTPDCTDVRMEGNF